LNRTPTTPDASCPEDLLPAIDARAEQDGQSAREIVRKALTANLAS